MAAVRQSAAAYTLDACRPSPPIPGCWKSVGGARDSASAVPRSCSGSRSREYRAVEDGDGIVTPDLWERMVEAFQWPRALAGSEG